MDILLDSTLDILTTSELIKFANKIRRIKLKVRSSVFFLKSFIKQLKNKLLNKSEVVLSRRAQFAFSFHLFFVL